MLKLSKYLKQYLVKYSVRKMQLLSKQGKMVVRTYPILPKKKTPIKMSIYLYYFLILMLVMFFQYIREPILHYHLFYECLSRMAILGHLLLFDVLRSEVLVYYIMKRQLQQLQFLVCVHYRNIY